MPDETAPEPSMDDILASIRRIISDDGAPSHADVHTLTNEAPAHEGEPMLLTKRVDPIAPKAEHSMTPETTPQTPAQETEWVGEPAASRAGDAFDKLSSVARAPTPAADSIAMPAPGRNLEDITRELLRPMLKEWLDENLPAIVQSRVDEEVDRITRRRVR